ncbi:MAG: hypothetical protein GWP15_00700 [Nitrospirae bacterium]|nr:hypothetical protein [Nitrospirota bacterium]
MTKVNTLNIPAYQRKRSLAAKARKSTTRIRKKTTAKPRRVTRARPTEVEEMTITDAIQESKLENPTDIFKPKRTTASGVREMKTCGHCNGFFDKINVGIIKLTSSLRVGDIIIFEKNEGLFEQEITSMQINRQDVTIAYAGDDIGLKIAMKPKVGTPVYKKIT